ncbi:hypothetical protein [Actinoplanes solisilvae]|uniref:hypothetical protein n=1 Tax=Actinoplanes solisilvae TaxID=2486853 RepID=UPI000FDA4339|nr:hypothetical protein [Actinoplanes solisilvae]
MDFWDATKVMFRRWYLTLPLLLLTAAGTGYTATAIEADYVLTSYVQLIPSQTALPEEEARKYPVNPWNQLGLEALTQAANYSTVDAVFLERLEKDGYSTNVKITTGDPVAGATFEVIGKTQEQATLTTDALIKRYTESTRALQAQYRVRPQDMITVQRLDQGENLERPGGKVKRAIIAVFGTGVLFTAALTIGVDAWLRRRKRKVATPEPQAAEKATGLATAVAKQGRVFNGNQGRDQATGRDQVAETVRIHLPNGVRREVGVKRETGEATIVLPTPQSTMNDNRGKPR